MAGLLKAGWGAAMVLAVAGLSRANPPAQATAEGHDYPTSARVEYVQDCMVRNGAQLALLYKCSCAIDRIAVKLTYDEFVDWGTFARHASLAGDRGGVFRDSDEARDKAKRFRAVESDAHRSCGLPNPT